MHMCENKLKQCVFFPPSHVDTGITKSGMYNTDIVIFQKENWVFVLQFWFIPRVNPI